MVSSYTQLLLRRYGEQLRRRRAEFMAYIVDGAARMKQLIEDLLAYSRVGTQAARSSAGASSRQRCAARCATCARRSRRRRARSPTTRCRRCTADDAQLAQLFQNLIGNALKFRSASVPRIHVSSVETETRNGEFAVRDNGIGIEPQYFERIFMVFQRLHNKGRVSRHRHRPGDLQEGGRAPRRPHLGRVEAGRGQRLPFHATERQREKRMVEQERARSRSCWSRTTPATSA